MSKCDLSIELEGGRESYQVGEEVAGQVHVEVNKNCSCDGLKISLAWYTHGKGNEDEGEAESTVAFTGEWQAGERVSYPFRFTMPAGPLTQHGHYINIDWRIKAEADIPWALDPEAEAEILLTKGDYEGELSCGDSIAEEPEEFIDAFKKKPGAFFVFMAVFIGIGGYIFSLGVMAVQSGDFGGIMFLVFRAISAQLGFVAIRPGRFRIAVVRGLSPLSGSVWFKPPRPSGRGVFSLRGVRARGGGSSVAFVSVPE